MQREIEVGSLGEDRENERKNKNHILSCPIDSDKPRQRGKIWPSKTKYKEI